LAYTFQRAINESLKLGAEIIVNTDADFQYNQTEIPKLIQPILEGKADIVSGDRQIKNLDHMVLAKKYGNIWGSRFVRLCADNNIEDASSGFRAFTKEAALKLFIVSNHTYTHQTLIQATHKNLAVAEIPVEFRKRENGGSKLIGNVPQHIRKSMATIMRTTLMYNSLKTFSYIGMLIIFVGLIPIGRWYWLSYWAGQGGQHVQSIIVGSLLITLGVFSILLGVISDLIALNRRYLEEILYLNRKREYERR
jgi:glycosyltransferase involved in cell wall biosynthesis